MPPWRVRGGIDTGIARGRGHGGYAADGPDREARHGHAGIGERGRGDRRCCREETACRASLTILLSAVVLIVWSERFRRGVRLEHDEEDVHCRLGEQVQLHCGDERVRQDRREGEGLGVSEGGTAGDRGEGGELELEGERAECRERGRAGAGTVAG